MRTENETKRGEGADEKGSDRWLFPEIEDREFEESFNEFIAERLRERLSRHEKLKESPSPS